MRGFPLMNFLLVLGVLGLGGLGLNHVTREPGEAQQAAARDLPGVAAGSVTTRVTLTLSAPARRVEISTPEGAVLLARQPQETRLVETLELPQGIGGLLVRVVWHDGVAAHRFAKLSLEPQRIATLEHVFDGRGDLDDLWEFPPLTLPSP